MKKIAHCIHHTHWDLIWYFTEQDAAVQLAYNVKEMLEGFRTGRIERFFFDGQTYPIAERTSGVIICGTGAALSRSQSTAGAPFATACSMKL